MRACYIRCPDLEELWREARGRPGGERKLTRKYAAFQVLVLDEWLLDRPDELFRGFLLEVAVGAPERLDRPEGPLAGLGANSVDELVEVHVGKRRRGLLHLAAPHPRPPGEVSAQLAVVHGLVGGVVALERPLVGEVVLVALHEAGLLDKEPGVGPRAALGSPRKLAHLPDGLGPVARHLGSAHEDGLVGVDARAGERPSALGAACRDDLLDYPIDVWHGTPLNESGTHILLARAPRLGASDAACRAIWGFGPCFGQVGVQFCLSVHALFRSDPF